MDDSKSEVPVETGSTTTAQADQMLRLRDLVNSGDSDGANRLMRGESSPPRPQQGEAAKSS